MIHIGSVGKPWLSDNGLRAEKRTCRSINLAWDPETLDAPLHQSISPSSVAKSPDLSLSEAIDESQHSQSMGKSTDTDHESDTAWYEVQMKLANTDQWKTVYKGYNTRCEVKELNPDANINFRLRKEGDENWGSIIVAATDASPPNAEDLHRAIYSNSEEMVLRIIGASRNTHVKKLLTSHDRSGMTPLMIAAQTGNNNILTILLQSGTLVNATSLSTQKTALMYAAFHGQLSTLQMLDRAGADWSYRDKTGCNALHHAINGGHLRIVLYILDRTGREFINDKDNSGWTPLMRAVVVGNSTEIVKLLLLRGADPNATDKINAKSCLMAAALLGKHEIVTQLLVGNADPGYINANDKSVLDVTEMFGSDEVKLQITDALNSKNGLIDDEVRKRRRHHLDRKNESKKGRTGTSATTEKTQPAR